MIILKFNLKIIFNNKKINLVCNFLPAPDIIHLQYTSLISAVRPTMQIDNWLTAASYQETASCRYTAHWYSQWSPMVQNRRHSPWKRKEH